jgi:hypothetical protein
MNHQLLVLLIAPLVAWPVGQGVAWLLKRFTDDTRDPSARFYSQLDAYRDVSEERKLQILSEVKKRLML